MHSNRPGNMRAGVNEAETEVGSSERKSAGRDASLPPLICPWVCHVLQPGNKSTWTKGFHVVHRGKGLETSEPKWPRSHHRQHFKPCDMLWLVNQHIRNKIAIRQDWKPELRLPADGGCTITWLPCGVKKPPSVAGSRRCGRQVVVMCHCWGLKDVAAHCSLTPEDCSGHRGCWWCQLMSPGGGG